MHVNGTHRFIDVCVFFLSWIQYSEWYTWSFQNDECNFQSKFANYPIKRHASRFVGEYQKGFERVEKVEWFERPVKYI